MRRPLGRCVLCRLRFGYKRLRSIFPDAKQFRHIRSDAVERECRNHLLPDIDAFISYEGIRCQRGRHAYPGYVGVIARSIPFRETVRALVALQSQPSVKIAVWDKHGDLLAPAAAKLCLQLLRSLPLDRSTEVDVTHLSQWHWRPQCRWCAKCRNEANPFALELALEVWNIESEARAKVAGSCPRA